ncbi:MAG: sensor histidine kinase [Amphritea sp.]|nr:sensor histidine kinase [Amphritea sp.]
MIIRYVKALVLLAFVIASGLAAASDVQIKNNWLFQHGDLPNWSQPLYDDSAWQTVEVPRLLFQGHNTPVKGWYRVHFDFNTPKQHDLALFIETIRHADETWLNGTRIGGLGETYEAWDFLHTNPQSLPRLYKIPPQLLTEKNNVLAIKTNVGFGEAWGAMFPGGAGITKGKVLIGDYDTLLDRVHNTKLKIITLDTVFAVLGILDLLIILVLLKTALGPVPEFKWLLACSFFLLLGAAAHDINYIYSIRFINTNLSMVTAMLVLPYTTAMYFWSQYRDISTKLITVLSAIWAFNITMLLLPSISFELKNICWYLWNIQAVMFFFYAIYAAFKGLIYKRVGAYAQFFGIIIYVFSIRSQWLPDDFFGHRNIQFGSIIYRYALLFAYFQQLTHIRMDFKKLSIRIVGITDSVRHSIARELHDGIGQHLASAKLQTSLALSSDEKDKHLDFVKSELEQAVQGLRRLINGLHPVIIDQTPINQALESECKNIGKIYGITTSLNCADVKMDKNTEIHVFRMFQECVSNAIKHGLATTIAIQLSTKKGYVCLSIRDNGIGFNIKDKREYRDDGGYGFVSLQERITLLSGHLDMTSETGKGSHIQIKFPLSPASFVS